MKSEKMHGYLCWKMKDAALIFLGTLMLFYGVHFMSTVKEGFRQRIFSGKNNGNVPVRNIYGRTGHTIFPAYRWMNCCGKQMPDIR